MESHPPIADIEVTVKVVNSQGKVAGKGEAYLLVEKLVQGC